MDALISDFGQRLAAAAIERKWSAVHAMLAPWLQASMSVDGVRKFFEDDYQRLLEQNGIKEHHYPKVPYVSGNETSLEFLRKKPSWLPRPRPIPHEITPENFRWWMQIQLQCDEEQANRLDCDYLTDIWLIVVEFGSELRVGYWSHDPYEVAPADWTEGG